MAGVLVLNATFEPLSVVPVRRAVCLVLDGKVELVAHTGRAVRSAHLAVPEPSVVRLDRYVNVPYSRHRAPSRRAVFARDHHRCQYCDGSAETVDHVVPRSRGGGHTWDNVVAACRRCNASKRDRLLGETPMRLRSRPGPPPPGTWIEVAAGTVPDSWTPFLVDRGRRSA